ncbi:MAG: hypothetical protein Ta2G_02260 [Termitinemataceae bacterium]|nr:MAG: hypothetical protein Ta2G_02260 [Termitinemataceae bacterium]
MKKYFALVVFTVICYSSFADNYKDPRADRFYFDIGLGGGFGYAKMGDSSFLGSFVNSVALNAGFKMGMGPSDSLPLFIVGEFDWNVHIGKLDGNNSMINSFFVGPGAIFYPSDNLQLAASLGLDVGISDAYFGFGGNLSIAGDLGKQYNGVIKGPDRNGHYMKKYSANGVLIGLNLFASTELKKDSEQIMYSVSVFLKYRYLKKDWPIFWDRR